MYVKELINRKNSGDVFSKDLLKLNTTNTLQVNKIGELLLRHNVAYTPEKPID